MSLDSFRAPRARRLASGLTVLAYAGTLLLSACGGGSSSAVNPQSAALVSASRLPTSGLARKFTTTHLSAAKDANSIVVGATASPGASTVQLRLPAGADASSLAVRLNGHDISASFISASCPGAVCMTANVASSDGYAAKNVVSAMVRTASGGMASGRARFAGGTSSSQPLVARRAIASAAPAAKVKALAATPDVCDSTTMCPPWLPPSVTFNTLQPGGWDSDKGGWFQINGQSYPTAPPPANCAGATYVAVVLDRQTLVEKTGGFESSPRCFTTGAELKGYLDALPFGGSDLVVTGTTWGSNATADLDTTTIGGTSYVNAKVLPLGYMAIGSGQQALGTAYENYYDNAGTDPTFNAYAYGTLQEDANGNYNFQSGDVVEYAVSPNDPGYFTGGSASSVIAMNVPPRYSALGETRRVYTPPQASPFNGLWMLVVDRMTLQPVPSQGCSLTLAGTVASASCGKVYINHGEDVNGQDAMWTQLASDLAAANAYQLVILVSSGVVGSGDQMSTYQNAAFYKYGFRTFAKQLAAIGGDASLVAGPSYNSSSDTFAMIGFAGAGNPLVGGAVVASTGLAQYGQSGVLHGLLQRNQNGLYLPGQVSQEPQALFTAKGGLDDADFVLAQVLYQPTTDWPSNSASMLLAGASSIDGQRAAYRFLSHWLLAGYYIKGISGPHQDDLHYFFSGSSNTSIDYHTMDSANLVFPTGGPWDDFGCSLSIPNTCTFLAPGDSAPSTFTLADFNAVKAQMSLEVHYLTNALQFLVTGSTNLKDVAAAGNANVGLALTSAASTILGSKFVNDQQVPSSTQVTLSWQAVLGLTGSLASALADAEGVGELTSAWDKAGPNTKTGIKAVFGLVNTVGAVLEAVVSGASLYSKSSTTPTSNPYLKFTTTIGELANADLQSQLLVGFDVLADNVTSDWGRLSAIGPRVTNTADTVFYAPNQVSQNKALDALTSSASQAFYFALLPSFYHIDYWAAVDYQANGNPTIFQPAVGSLSGTIGKNCAAFYLSPNQFNGLGALSSYQGMGTFSFGGEPVSYNGDQGQFDLYVIAGKTGNPKTKNTFIPSIDNDLAQILFAPDQLNIPMQLFVAANGPMQVLDASVSNPSGFANSSVCDVWDYPPDNAVGAPVAGAASDRDVHGDIVTTTTISSASSHTLGQDTVLTAVVKAGDQSVPGGAVYFTIDGVIVGKAAVGTDGTATLTLPTAAIGHHAVQADYSSPDGYAVSSSPKMPLGVYAGAPDLNVFAASTSLDVSYDKASSPLALTISSLSGLAGDVQLSCSGLPVGMSCSFDAKSTQLAADGSLTASVVIGPNVLGKAAAGLLLPLLLVGWRREDGTAKRRHLLPGILAVCIAAASLSACGGGSSTPEARETGSKTVLINATVGQVTRSVAIGVNIR